MGLTKHRGGWIITISFLIAFLLAELPIPTWTTIWRPSWVAIVLIYWCLAIPERVRVGTGWLVGLIIDILGGSLLGQHAVGLCIVAFIVVKLHQQIRALPVWQQGMGIFVLITLYQLLILWINGIQGHPVSEWAYISSALTSTLIWPWAFIILRDVRRKYQVK
uniref:Rod shape-determining protein MreD n=1 Tax=Candidatus Kentrum sp. TUN TaxID=2126343 RepID=A0A450ZEJ9_9GAMM|nr:MAG: rod shape-determining protein MreD [Candidatus Kentron sp. TUN]VFK52190.1 MAG: rod shape-determining protein MreD [Candidatus Kentron sp. TUN]VFK61675.1 MAG: rod shape-determining protein MreD [Candidatus Kentron sp. TUN]